MLRRTSDNGHATTDQYKILQHTQVDVTDGTKLANKKLISVFVKTELLMQLL